jgi:DNA-binding SARP family transcriptional activator
MSSGSAIARVGRVVRGLVAFGALAALVAGIPWALWHFIGWPLPHHVPSIGEVLHALNQRGIPDQALLDALAVVVWITWASLVVSIAVEVPAALSGRHAPRLPLAGMFQPVTGHLVAAVIVAGLTLAPRPTHASAPGSLSGGPSSPTVRRPVAALVLKDAIPFKDAVLTDASSPLTPATPTVPAISAEANAAPTSATAPSLPAGASTTYVVQRGDTLWGIAERQLGDPLRWAEIYRLNEGRPQPGGRTLTDPHWIDPGWTLVLPTTAASTVPSAPAPPPPATVPAPPPAPTQPAAAPPPTIPPPRSAANDDTQAHASGNAPTPGLHQPLPTTEHPGSSAGPLSPPWLALPSGSRLGASFVAGVLSALAARRLRRRRRYRPQPPQPGRRPADPTSSAGLHDLLGAVRNTTHDPDDEFNAAVHAPPVPLTAIPDDDAILHPDVIEVASRGDQAVHLALCDWPGLTLAGPGVESVLRAWLAALVARNGPYGAEILVTRPLGDRLFPGVDLPSLRRVENMEAVLSWLETAVIGRTRRLDDADVPDAAAHRRQSPEYPFPVLVAVAVAVPGALDVRWHAVLKVASRLGMAALVITNDTGAGPSDPRLVVGEDGSMAHVAPPALAELLEASRLFGLTASDGVDLLTPIAAVHNDEPEEPEVPLAEPDGNAPAVAASGEGGRASVEAADTLTVVWPAVPADASEPAPIRVSLLGPACVEAWEEEINSGLRASAYELLAWYALHPDGATAEAAIDALWPDASPQRGRERFWTALGNLRSRLHGPTKDGVEILTKVGEHYRPDPAVVDIDLWHFEAALTTAARAGNPAEVTAPLELAVAAYRGDFYPNGDALWVEPVREDLHRRALDAQLRLAELYADHGRPDAAIAALEQAIELDPICEDAYRRLITLLAHLHRDDAAQRSWRLLQGRLAELDLEPEDKTARLVHELFPSRPTSIRDLQARR